MTHAPRRWTTSGWTWIAGALLAVLASDASADPIRVEAGRTAEVAFTSARDRTDPFNQTTVDVTFTDPDGRTFRVPAFWAGGGTWKARYSSRKPGSHAFVSSCSDADDPALHGVAGVVEVVPYQGDNPLLVHGPIRVADDRRHFAYEDGTPFFWLGDTW